VALHGERGSSAARHPRRPLCNRDATGVSAGTTCSAALSPPNVPVITKRDKAGRCCLPQRGGVSAPTSSSAVERHSAALGLRLATADGFGQLVIRWIISVDYIRDVEQYSLGQTPRQKPKRAHVLGEDEVYPNRLSELAGGECDATVRAPGRSVQFVFIRLGCPEAKRKRLCLLQGVPNAISSSSATMNELYRQQEDRTRREPPSNPRVTVSWPMLKVVQRAFHFRGCRLLPLILPLFCLMQPIIRVGFDQAHQPSNFSLSKGRFMILTGLRL
jgi:hypothetical protein